MEEGYTPKITAADIVGGDVVIAFNDGTELLFKAEVLHHLFLLGSKVRVLREPGNDPDRKPALVLLRPDGENES